MLSLQFVASLTYRYFDAVSAIGKHSFLVTNTTTGKCYTRFEFGFGLSCTSSNTPTWRSLQFHRKLM